MTNQAPPEIGPDLIGLALAALDCGKPDLAAVALQTWRRLFDQTPKPPGGPTWAAGRLVTQ